MNRFMALNWTADSNEKSKEVKCIVDILISSSPKWIKIFEAPGCIILLYTDEMHTSNACSGSNLSILGTINTKMNFYNKSKLEYNSKVTHLEQKYGEDPKSLFRHFTENYWGDYFLFFFNREDYSFYAYKSPFGKSKCYRSVLNGINLLFTNIEDYIKFNDKTIKLKNRYLIGLLRGINADLGETGLEGVEELVGGQLVILKEIDVSLEWIWKADRIYRQNKILNQSDAAQALREQIISSVAASVQPYSGIMIWLSGGLDSSIIAGTLNEIPDKKKIVCVNNHYFGGAGDERHFANKVAEKLGHKLIVRSPSLENYRFDLLDLVKPSPTIQNYHYCINDLVADIELSRSEKLDVLLSGLAGDIVLHSFRSEAIARDYINDHGFSLKFFKICYNLAIRQKATIYDVIARSLSKPVENDTYSTPEVNNNSFNALYSHQINNLQNSSELNFYPRYVDSILPEGKTEQFRELFVDTGLYPPVDMPGVIPSLAPLHTQPVIETCLSIPSYILTDYGRNRGLARQAFRKHLPDDVYRRQAKGETSIFVSEFCIRHRTFLMDYLLHGALSESGLLNRTELEKVLASPENYDLSVRREIYNIFNIEVWLKTWKNIGAHLNG